MARAEDEVDLKANFFSNRRRVGFFSLDQTRKSQTVCEGGTGSHGSGGKGKCFSNS
jgi:hypothetical protein